MIAYQNLFSEKLAALKQQGNYRHFQTLQKSVQHFPNFYFTDADGHQHTATNWCSNDYLCMSLQEDVIAKACTILHRAGAGSGGTRNIAGTTQYHIALENTLSSWHKKEAALLFNSAFNANFTTLQCLGRAMEDLVFFSDEKNHASIIEGIRSVKNTKHIFKHNNLTDLENLLAASPIHLPKIIVCESVYSMNGTIAPLKEIAILAKKYQALTYVDEVHAVGLYGTTGAGIIEREHLENEIDIVNGTLSKAIGTFGGYITASTTIIDFVRSFGSGFIFTTSLPPAICAAATKSIQLIQEQAELRNHFHQNVQLLRNTLKQYNITFEENDTHITFIAINNPIRCKAIADELLKAFGIYLQPINYPTVAKGNECLRIVANVKHAHKHMLHLANSLQKVLNDTVTLIGRNSALSLYQLQMVKEKITAVFPHKQVKIITKNSLGDTLQNIPLQYVDGTDFFTEDIYKELATGEADIAVHSLKDMSANHFFGENSFAVIDRDNVRDVAIFNENILEKIQAGENIVIGTCSPRREEMAIQFLQKALPQLNENFTISTKHIRGNIDSRINKLHQGNYDGIIIAVAGVNRLLLADATKQLKALLATKRIMVLPIIECAPAPCQGAIVAEASEKNAKAIEIINAINNPTLYAECAVEKKEALQYGLGCMQKFGLTTISQQNHTWLYAAGKNNQEIAFSHWHNLPNISLNEKDVLFDSTECMKDFFSYSFNDVADSPLHNKALFIASHKALHSKKLVASTVNKAVFVSGTKTWLHLAKQGVWITGSADALGFEQYQHTLSMPLLQISNKDISIVTNANSALHWQKQGLHTLSTYTLIPSCNEALFNKLQGATHIFWSSFQQYNAYKNYVKQDAIFMCASGATATLFTEAGIQPIIFPTIQSFHQWKHTIQVHYAV